MTLGEKIKDARKQAGLSQEQFAEKMNVSRSAVAKWETIIDFFVQPGVVQVLDYAKENPECYLVEKGS